MPRETADLLRPRVPEVAAAIIAAVGRDVPEYRRPLEGAFGRNLRAGVETGLAAFVDLLGRDEDIPERGLYEALGRGELRQGRTLDALQAAYRIGGRLALRAVAVGVRELGLDPDVALVLAEAVYAYIDELADASVAGYTSEQAARAGATQARRHALLELVAREPAVGGHDLRRAAEHAGVPVPQTVAVLAVGDADAVQVARRLPSGAVGAGLEPVGLVLLPDPDGPGRAARLRSGVDTTRAVLGPTVPFDDASRSARRALAAWPLHVAGRLGEEWLVRAEEHLLALLLAALPDLAADLVTLRLAPLDGLPAGARARAVETLRAWLDAHGDVTVTAEALHVHSQTVRYRLGRLEESFGETLADPRARLELALALRAGRRSRRRGDLTSNRPS